jgi:para-nitrobenzyl esterase
MNPDGSIKGAALPVMVWFPGGNYEVESAGEPLYDGSLLAASDVIVVTVSYRLGALGFAALNVGGLEGFYGVKDQVHMLLGHCLRRHDVVRAVAAGT